MERVIRLHKLRLVVELVGVVPEARVLDLDPGLLLDN